MIAGLSETDRAVFTAVWKRRTSGGLSLASVSAEVGLTPPGCLARLRQLQRLGLIARLGQRRPKYVPRQYFEARVVDPVEGLVDSWQINELPDWRFPLVGRVRDAAARISLNQFLGRLWDLGLVGTRASRAFAVVAYGSCVDGTARKGSDLDLLILTNSTSKARVMKEAAAMTNLDVERKIDLRVLSMKAFQALPEELKIEIRNGKTVLRTAPDIPLLEAQP